MLTGMPEGLGSTNQPFSAEEILTSNIGLVMLLILAKNVIFSFKVRKVEPRWDDNRKITEITDSTSRYRFSAMAVAVKRC
jgi:hypothetical protein